MAKMVYEITGQELTDVEMKGVVVGCLDPLTCQHTTSYHGGKSTCRELRSVVNTFITNNVRDSNSMQIGSLEQDEPKKEDYYEDEDGGELNAPRGKGKGKCYNCGGKGHIAANCPSLPQQKGGKRWQGRQEIQGRRKRKRRWQRSQGPC